MSVYQASRDNDPLMNMSNAEREQAERISALVDGEHDVSGFANSVAREDASARRWARYQSIGEMLRSPELVPTARDEAFMTRMRLSLAAEPIVVAPQSQAALGARINETKPTAEQRLSAAGGARAFPLKAIGMAGGLAVLVAVAMSWSSFMPTRTAPSLELSQQTPKPAPTANASGAVTQVADKREVQAAPAVVSADPPALVVVQTVNGTMIRNARLDQYFAAHSGMRSGNVLGGGASMAAPAAFVRGASIDNADKQ
jgi:sigma-E factor negative regulatory protein RseA